MSVKYVELSFILNVISPEEVLFANQDLNNYMFYPSDKGNIL